MIKHTKKFTNPNLKWGWSKWCKLASVMRYCSNSASNQQVSNLVKNPQLLDGKLSSINNHTWALQTVRCITLVSLGKLDAYQFTMEDSAMVRECFWKWFWLKFAAIFNESSLVLMNNDKKSMMECPKRLLSYQKGI